MKMEKLTHSIGYIIYIDPNTNVVKAKKMSDGSVTSTASAPATEVDTTTLFNRIFTNLQSVGGLIYATRGHYNLSGSLNIGKPDSTLSNTPITLVGDGMDATVFKFSSTATTTKMINVYCNATIRGFTVDGNGRSAGLVGCNSASYIMIDQIKFQNNASGINLQIYTPNAGTGCKGQIVRNCSFDKTDSSDQCAVGIVEYALIDGCVFDKRTAGSGANGSTLGSCLTSGSGNHIKVTNCTFYRVDGSTSPCISIEPFGWAYEQLDIIGNTFKNGITIIGGTGDWTSGGNSQSTTYRTVNIIGNAGNRHTIKINGPETALGGHIQDVNIVANNLKDGNVMDISLYHVQGPTLIAANTLRDSNMNNIAGGIENGLIWIDTANDTEIYGNVLQLTAKRTDNVLKYFGIDGLRFYNNKILVQNGANGTGIINPISGTNVSAWDNEGYLTNNEGSSNFRGNGSTTTFTVNHGMNSTPTVVTADATVSIAKKICNIGSSSFDVVFVSAPPLGSFTVYWRASRRSGF
jgi:hypothetical protein